MIHSMTGFGDAEVEVGGQVLHVEIRTFNQRYLKTSIHLPDEFGFLENDVDRLLREHLTRGSVTLRLFVRSTGELAAAPLNSAAVTAYVRQLRALAGDDPRCTIDLATLLTLPGVCQPSELAQEDRELRWQQLRTVVGAALERLIAMRAAEGQALGADLRVHCGIIRGALERVRTRSPHVIEEYRDRLRTRVQQLLAGSGVQLGAEDLLKEVSIYAERSDISEEISRLAAHLDQFDGLLISREPAGRKLEFIAQEMLREANTMGSKTGDAAISREIIEIKSAVDRIKEQVANAE
ncbi:MAG: YicC family protein [Phycisphaerales bacterium]|nr:YicC family protein [Phycisphaerales bacterium]